MQELLKNKRERITSLDSLRNLNLYTTGVILSNFILHKDTSLLFLAPITIPLTYEYNEQSKIHKQEIKEIKNIVKENYKKESFENDEIIVKNLIVLKKIEKKSKLIKTINNVIEPITIVGGSILMVNRPELTPLILSGIIASAFLSNNNYVTQEQEAERFYGEMYDELYPEDRNAIMKKYNKTL
jgi:rubrerythrin